jgi:anaerobic selenocysteine-containing dehydrogenase
MSTATKTPAARTVHRACHLCEAICGLEFTIEGSHITAIRGDDADTFSRGHICPKAVALKDIHEDENRLRRPVKRVGETWQEISWDEAFELAATRIAAIQTSHGNNAVGFYAGNPSAHNSGTLFNVRVLGRALKTRNMFSASSVDQLPQQLASFLMYGHQFMIPIPDIDHTDYFLILGGNPLASNGSMMTVPDVTKRLAAIRARSGKVVVIDPRRTETAEVASEHHFIRPASDAAFLMALLNTLREENLLNASHPDQLAGLDAAFDAIRDVTPEVAARATGIDAATVRRIAREFAAASGRGGAVCYGRVGTTLQAFGTLNQWLVQLVNIVTGNLDRVGGALPTTPILPLTGPGTSPGHYAEWRSRVRGLPESGGELPVAALSEEILTPGEGQIRALVTTCGNPVISTPDGTRLDEALASLAFMVSIDIYINETTRHADLILPPTSSLNHEHYDSIFNAFAVRNVTRLNPALWPKPDDERFDWEVIGELAKRVAQRMTREVKPAQSTRAIVEAVVARGTAVHGIDMPKLDAAVHGIDLGPLKPSLFSRLETPDKKVQCAPPAVVADVARFRKTLAAPASPSLVLIGRRHVRSNNSWMHGSHRLMKGKPRDQLMMHPHDAAARALADGQRVRVTSPHGSVEIAIQITDTMMPGVVSLPHGFGHARAGTRLGLAHAHAGVSYNDLSGTDAVDAVSGNAALNGTPVEVFATSS